MGMVVSGKIESDFRKLVELRTDPLHRQLSALSHMPLEERLPGRRQYRFVLGMCSVTNLTLVCASDKRLTVSTLWLPLPSRV